MRKTQLALAAVALVASTAVMANGVKVYGNLDAGLIGGKSATADGGVHFTQGEWSGNQWGLTGSEDLGGGLKAGFTLEGGLSTANGNLSNGGGAYGVFNRQSFVSLGGDFGSVALGRQFSPQVGAILANLPQTQATFHVPMLEFAGALNYQNGTETAGSAYKASGGFFVANAVSYTSPNVGGFSGTVMNARSDESGKGEGTLGSVTGSFGGVNVNASYHTYTSSSSGYSVGANTAIGGLKVGVNYVNTNTNATTTTADIQSYTLGVAYPVTDALTLGVNYAANDKAAAKATLLNINGAYNLSKMTQVYVFYSDANTNSYSSYSSFQRSGAKGGSQYGAGLAVNF
jgi:predicted porin